MIASVNHRNGDTQSAFHAPREAIGAPVLGEAQPSSFESSFCRCPRAIGGHTLHATCHMSDVLDHCQREEYICVSRQAHQSSVTCLRLLGIVHAKSCYRVDETLRRAKRIRCSSGDNVDQSASNCGHTPIACRPPHTRTRPVKAAPNASRMCFKECMHRHSTCLIMTRTHALTTGKRV